MTDEKNKSALKSYTIGFILSILLTLLAFGFTAKHVNSGHYFISHEFIIPIILGIALVQLVIQLVFFLHILKEDKPRWNLLFFIGTFGLVFLLVAASLIIMNNLNKYHVTPESATEYILIDEGIKTKSLNRNDDSSH